MYGYQLIVSAIIHYWIIPSRKGLLWNSLYLYYNYPVFVGNKVETDIHQYQANIHQVESDICPERERSVTIKMDQLSDNIK